jgi:hypothetical protein
MPSSRPQNESATSDSSHTPNATNDSGDEEIADKRLRQLDDVNSETALSSTSLVIRSALFDEALASGLKQRIAEMRERLSRLAGC